MSEGGEMSRRGFFKIAFATGLGLIGLKGEPTRSKVEAELHPTILVLDLFDVSKLKDRLPKNDPAVDLLAEHYKNHGENDIAVMRKTAAYMNPNNKDVNFTQSSITGGIQIEDTEKDDIGNSTTRASVSTAFVDKQVSQSTESVINMSFEMGEFAFTYTAFEKRSKYPEMARQGPSTVTINDQTTYKDYQGNAISEAQYDALIAKASETQVVQLDPASVDFLDGYAGDKTMSNLKALVEIAIRHPEKMFVAAGGNPTYLKGEHFPDISQARKLLEQKGLWPENLLIVGFTANPRIGADVEYPASRGADIYVRESDLKQLGFSAASSYATPVISEIVRELVGRGTKTKPDIRKKLFGMTDIKEIWWNGNDHDTYRLLNLDQAKQSILV